MRLSPATLGMRRPPPVQKTLSEGAPDGITSLEENILGKTGEYDFFDAAMPAGCSWLVEIVERRLAG